MDEGFLKWAYADLAACVVGSLLWFSGSAGAHSVGRAILIVAGTIAIPSLFIVFLDVAARVSMLWSRSDDERSRQDGKGPR